jgi:ribonucleoside-diphosphate reductase alpha chain
MDIFDKMCFTISSAGGRRGAQMATFGISHPDVLDFIQAKRTDGCLRQFNLSLLISDEFMQAVMDDRDWPLVFPVTQSEVDAEGWDVHDDTVIIWRDWPDGGHYVRNETGQVACRIYKSIKAGKLWDTIMRSTYDFAEPGFILIDHYNEMNNNWFCEHIRATNPCGEQGLPPYGACLLGSINLVHFVTQPFSEDAEFDWPRFREVTKIFTRMLDNVVEINGLPLEQQRQEIIRKRRHGMGVLGLGSALTLLGIPYGSEASLQFTEQVSRELAVAGWQAALELSNEKGPAPIMEEEFIVTEHMLHMRPEMRDDGWQPGMPIKGKVLHARYSRYMQQLSEIEPELVQALAEHGARFTHHSSIAPTGTIALSLANNVSNGIEPSFSHHYSRNVIRRGKKTKEKMDVFSYELLAYRHYINPNAMPLAKEADSQLPSYFVSAEDITPTQHVDVQASAQKWIDSSISKTANVPTDYPYEDFKDIYRYAYSKKLKGCTTFRFNPKAFQGVLVNNADLEQTHYRFTLDDGSTLEFKGSDTVEYDGELHNVANLHDALKEGYYGKF